MLVIIPNLDIDDKLTKKRYTHSMVQITNYYYYYFHYYLNDFRQKINLATDTTIKDKGNNNHSISVDFLYN